MKTGMNLLLWTTHVTSEHFPILEKLKKAGFDGVEIPIFEGDANHYKGLRKQLDNLGLACTSVTVATPDANPISPDAKLRQAAVERMKGIIEMSAILGSKASTAGKMTLSPSRRAVVGPFDVTTCNLSFGTIAVMLTWLSGKLPVLVTTIR